MKHAFQAVLTLAVVLVAISGNAQVPVVTYFAINDGAASTFIQDVVLNNTCTNSPFEYRAREAGRDWTAWLPYSDAPPFTLSWRPGQRTVDFQVRNASGESSIVSDAIELIGPPTVTYFEINNGAASTPSRDVVLNNTCTNSPVEYQAEEEGGAMTGWMPYSSAPSFTLSSGPGKKIIDFRVRNDAGTSQTVTDSIELVDKVFLLQDVNLASLGVNRQVQAYTVENNPPLHTRTLIGTFSTDSQGRITVPSSSINLGDWVQIEYVAHTEPAIKHIALLPDMYSIVLDNLELSPPGNAAWDAVDGNPTQTIVLDHTTIVVDLLISVEWDAMSQYLQNLLGGMRLMSNVLYDAFDGQLRLANVRIFDNGENWDQADIHIFASNYQWPRASVTSVTGNPDWRFGGGIRFIRLDPPGFGYLLMPRIFYYNNRDANRNLTYTHYPYDWMIPLTEWTFVHPNQPVRTLSHEFGHYFVGFFDEYEDSDGNRIFPNFDFGTMDRESWLDCPQCSEHSSQDQYTDVARQITEQWVGRGNRSCWDYFDWQFSDTYDGVQVSIDIPLAPNVLDGPNDDLTNLDYDVGAFIPAGGAITDFDGNGRMVVVTSTLPSPDDGFDATLTKTSTTPIRVLPQGRTADAPNAGSIRILGANSGDEVDIAGQFFPVTKSGGSSDGPYDWHYGQGVIGAEDDLHIDLASVNGSFPLICDVELLSDSMVVRETPLETFPAEVTFDIYVNGYLSGSGGFSYNGSVYVSQMLEYTGAGGLFRTWAVDNSSNTFFFDMQYVLAILNSSYPGGDIFGPNGAVDVLLDGTNDGIQKAIILSSPYPVIRNGLTNESYQAGSSHAFDVYPDVALAGDNRIAIKYADSDLPTEYSGCEAEVTLRVFKWNYGSTAWEVVGGVVDTTGNSVVAAITETGVYAAFTTAECGSGCCEGRVGDANGSGEDEPTISDISVMIDAKFITGSCDGIIQCLAEADVNQSGGTDPTCDDITISDISTLIDYLFITGPETATLPDCL